MNAKSEVRSSKGNDYCPVVSTSNVILEMFQLVAAGLPRASAAILPAASSSPSLPFPSLLSWKGRHSGLFRTASTAGPPARAPRLQETRVNLWRNELSKIVLVIG